MKTEKIMKFRIQSKEHRFEIIIKDVEELINELEEDEIPCTVTNCFTNVSFKLTKKMLFGTKKNGETFCKRLPGLRRCSFE